MSILWLILGGALLILVASVLFGFFVYRPRAKQTVTKATEAIATELHGRPPLLIAPAQCRKAQMRDADSVRGLGVIAVTEQAVLFSTGQRVAILARDGLHATGSGTTVELQSQTPPATMVLTMPDPSALLKVLDV